MDGRYRNNAFLFYRRGNFVGCRLWYQCSQMPANQYIGCEAIRAAIRDTAGMDIQSLLAGHTQALAAIHTPLTTGLDWQLAGVSYSIYNWHV